jgi:hypothetical protein
MRTLMSKTVIVDGKLLYKDLSLVWGSEYPESLHSTLLHLLQKIEILHNFPNESMALIPFMFPDKSQAFEEIWMQNQSYLAWKFHRVFKFDFLPNTFITRLILHMLTVVDVHYYWKEGMILQTETEQVRVELVNLNEIQLHFRGNSKVKKLARLILDTIDSFLTGGRQQLEYQVLIPCAHCMNLLGVDLSVATPYYFDISVLEEAVAKGENYLYCHDVAPVRIGT